jgi:MoxR-like ATPase
MALFKSLQQLQQALSQTVVGQEELARHLLLGLLCNGNVLLEGFPGTAKTRAVKTLAMALDAQLSRIQFTPDLLPSDVTGTEVFHQEGGEERLQFQPGPLFANLVLADEINRAPAKVQSALLEAMEERQVTVAGQSYALPELFMVLATQNPLEQEGTYPLPEAQLDRFLLKVNVHYPDDAAELNILRLVRGEENSELTAPDCRVSQEDIFAARAEIKALHIADSVEQYIVDLVMATRDCARYPDSALQQWIAVGCSSRATIALDRCARAQAWLQGKDFVDPDDVRTVAYAVMRHRMVLTYEALADGISADDVVKELLLQVAVA